jgi:signal peptidase
MFKKIIKIVGKVVKFICIIMAVMILSIIAVQRFSDNKVNLFGYGVYTIVTQSMIPEYDVGDMIFAKKVEKIDLNVGDDIVYQGKKGDFKDKVVTHRIVKKTFSTLTTKGIANSVEDPEITYDQVYGKVMYKFGLLSLFSKLMNDSILFYFIVFVPFTIIIFFDIVGIFKDKEALEEEIEEENNKDKKIKKIDFVDDFDDDEDE